MERYVRAPFFERRPSLGPSRPTQLRRFGYYVLAALSLSEFVLNWADWRGWRTLVWLGFLMLSAYQERTISFFAVVAGPITALNFQISQARDMAWIQGENPWKTISIASGW